MPGRLFLIHTKSELRASFQCDLQDDPPLRRNISPGQEVLTFGPNRKILPMRWGIIPVGRKNARGRPVMETIINARSETVFEKSAFHGVRRVVVPASGWYEWTGEKRRKTAWAIRPSDGGLLAFAGIADTWKGPGGISVEQVATVTCAPNDDLAKVHHRMGVLLDAKGVAAWLSDSEADARGVCRPWPQGRLDISEAQDVDWSAP